MGVIAELFSDDRGLVWPDNIAPYRVYLVNIGDSPEVLSRTQEVYEALQANGIDVLWDDRSVRPGEKFADGDLMGIPHRVVVSEKTMANDNLLEYKGRTDEQAVNVSLEDLIKKLTD